MALNLYQSNYIKELEEEIALEGLDGITIDALWLRLLDRCSCSIRPTNDQTKSFLWEAVIRMGNVKFYLLPAPRPPIFIFKRLENMDQCGYYIEPVYPPSCYNYPHFPVDSNGDMGSCPLYSQRDDITAQARHTPLEKAVRLWGSKLVVVADQKTRLQLLVEPESNLQAEMNAKQFCFLERVGRSRQHGEITQGKTGLQVISEDSKTLFYYKKFLSKRKLIKQQLFFVKAAKGNINGLIIHLSRFASEIKTKFMSDADKLSEFLKSQPKGYALYRTVADKFGGMTDLKKLLPKETKRFRSEMIPYRSVYPDAKPAEWKTKNQLAGEKSLRIIRFLGDPASDDEGEDDDGEEENGIINFQYRTYGLSLVRQCCELIDTAGPQGLTQAQVGKILGLSNLHSRGLCRYLHKKGICDVASQDKGRQRAIHYIAKKYKNSDLCIKSELETEVNKLKLMLTSESTNEPPAKKLKVDESGSSFFKNIMKEVPEENRPSQEDMDAIETRISMSEYVPEKDKSLNSLIGDSSDSSLVTPRLVRRAHLIVKAVNTHRVIHDPQKLQRMINEEEAHEGHKHTVDRKTVMRLLDKLVRDGHVRFIKIRLSGHGKDKTLFFVVHPSIDGNHSEVRSAIEQAKMKLPIITKESVKREKMQQLLNSPAADVPFKFNLGKYDHKAGRKYGLKPKFVKKQVLHAFIYYLAYEHKGQEPSAKEVKTLLQNMNVDLSLMNEMSTVYSTAGDWKTFLPPVPVHEGYSKGWVLVSDLLVRLPLTLFLSLVNVPYEIPGIMEYLNHPIKKYYLVKHLPPEIAHSLTIHRKYIFTISELITKLAFMGLIQVGPQKMKEKDQYFVFVNRHAVLMDTTPSGSGYNHISNDMEYEPIKYELKGLSDVEQYWYDLWNFAMNTNLGCRNVMTGKQVVIESVSTKKILLEAVRPRENEEAVQNDVGYLPGDHLGAAGLDSDLFVHLKRNWYWTADGKIGASPSKIALETRKPSVRRANAKKREHSKGDNPSFEFKKIKLVASKTKGETSNDEETPEDSQAVQGDEESGKRGFIVTREKVEVTGDVVSTRAKHKKITRVLKPKAQRTTRKPYYDQIDKEALRRMVKLRVDWSSSEDNLLLICKVATLFMCAESRRHVAKNFCLVREILHSTYPSISRNKTSRACQRRMTYMMKNPSTAHSVYLCLEEIKQDPEIVDKFSMAVEKLDRQTKSQGKGPKICQAEYDKVYKDLCTCLFSKLKTIDTPDEATLENVSIPDTIDQFREMFNVVVPKDLRLRYGSYAEVQNTVDIMCSVVNVIIHSSLCCSNDKNSYSYQLFYVYQKYPDKLLRSVMARCRSMQIVSCRKRYKRWKAANSGCLPLSSSPYQLSITYANILQTRYQYRIFQESHTSLGDLLGKFDYQRRAVDALPSSSQTEIPSLADVQVKSGGECANVVELFSSGFIEVDVQFPQNLIILDPRLAEKDESYTLIMKRFKDMLTIIQANNKVCQELDEDVDEDEEFNNKTPSLDEGDLQEKFNLSNKSGVANTASRLALYMMRDEPPEYLDKSLQHAHDYFVLKPCKIRVKIDEEKIAENVTNIVKERVGIIKEIQRLAHFPDETIDNADIIEKLEGTCDQNVLQRLVEFIETKKELGALYKDILINVSGSLDEIHHSLDQLITSQFVLRTGNVSVRFVHNRFRKPWLVRSYYIPKQQRVNLPKTSPANTYAIQLREDSDEEAPVEEAEPASGGEEAQEAETSESKGGEEPTNSGEPEGGGEPKDNEEPNEKPKQPLVMVLRNKKKRWASLQEHTFGDFDFSRMKPVQIHMKPWIRVDGTLNRKVLDRMLGSIYGQCLTTPGIPLKALQNRFTPVLQPAHTYELTLLLQKIGCVELKVLNKSGKVNLLSKRRVVKEEPACGYEDAENMAVHTLLLGVTRLGQFLNERLMNKDYLDALTDSRLLSFS